MTTLTKISSTCFMVFICLGAANTTLAVAQDEPQSCQALVQTLAEEGRVALIGVHFDFNRASLRPESLPTLISARDAILTLGGSWRIEGHTDDRGSHEYNQRLSESRALAVRDWLVSAGVTTEHLAAQGFSFDRPVADNTSETGRAQNRRVELAGEVTPDMLGFGGPAGVDPCADSIAAHDVEAPAITAWTGSGGQEFLPFSFLMATGYGGPEGWEGDRISMPSGTQAQSCQALCQAEERCAAFSFEPAGSNFIETASCSLIGYGAEMDLWRSNNYLDGGTFTASGLKPDAQLLTPESEALAQQILADMAEIETLRATVKVIAADSHAPETFMDAVLVGGVPPERYQSYLEIADLGDYEFGWWASKSSLYTHDMSDGSRGQLWVPEAGDYTLRYVINHPTAGQHSIVEQAFSVRVEAASGVVTSEFMHRCEGAGFEPCEIRDSGNDLVFSLLPGYGVTEPYLYRTAAGVVADRPSFELVRLHDGAVIATINPRQGSGPLCLRALNDFVCVDETNAELDQLAAFALVGSLTTLSAAQETEAMGEDGVLEEPGALQGVWVMQVDDRGTAQDGLSVAVIELIQSEGDLYADGSFQVSPNFALLASAYGRASITVNGERFIAVLDTDDGQTLVFDALPYGDDAFRGTLQLARQTDAGSGQAILRRMAGPGETWVGEPWMHGELDGMAEALRMSEQVIRELMRNTAPNPE